MKLVLLDGYSINPGDLSWEPLTSICEFICYDRTAPDEIVQRIGNADGFFVSKCKITKEIMSQCPRLKFIGITATGVDNVDTNAAKELGIAVCNIPAYSTDSVAQHVFALLLEITNNVGLYNHGVQTDKWYNSPDFTFIEKPLMLLTGKSLGIVGYGNIGKRVAEIAKALGMNVNIYSQDKEAAIKSDIVTLHCPATTETKGFINKDFIAEMKDGAILINTARGALVNEKDLAAALISGKLSAAAVDVIDGEPPKKPHPLIGLENCILTPHIAWMPKEARQIVINSCAENLTSFINNGRLNRIV